MTCMGNEKFWQSVTLIMHLLYELYIYTYTNTHTHTQILNSLYSKLSEQTENQGKLNKHTYGYTFQRTGAQCYLAGPVPLLQKS
jgi:hypothetical protein